MVSPFSVNAFVTSSRGIVEVELLFMTRLSRVVVASIVVVEFVVELPEDFFRAIASKTLCNWVF